MTRALTTALAALTLTACVRLPPTTRPALPEERAAIDATVAAFEAARGPTPCALLDRVDVAPLPPDELHAWCMNDTADACVSTVQRYPFASGSTFLRVLSTVDRDVQLRLIQHESSHVIRHCWVRAGVGAEFTERLLTGASEDCTIYDPTDLRHCDRALWDAILADAWLRFTGGED